MSNLITQEEVSNVIFSKEDILHVPELRKQRLKALTDAMKLGNIYKNHVRIFFKDQWNQTLNIKATVWSVTEKYVILKSQKVIPINSIVNVELI